MHATLNRVSLVTELDIPYREPSGRYFEDPAHFEVEVSRALLHEATHYWQQLSSPALLLLAGEDWHRLLEFERSGTVDDRTPLRAELGAPHPSLGFSVMDLAECTSRYWDILNVGPHNLVEADLSRGATPDPKIHSEYEALVAEGLFRSSDDGYSPATVSLAMRFVGGSYARPYASLEARIGDFAMHLFPLLSHWALQTSNPVRFLDTFTLHAGAEVARSLKWSKRLQFLRRTDPVERFEQDAYQDELYLKLRPLLSRVAQQEGTAMHTAGEGLAHTPLANHPVYTWAMGWIREAGRAALEGGLGNDIRRQFRGEEAQAWAMADRMLALPGGPYRPYLYWYLKPPIHRFSDDKTWFTNVEPVNDDNARIAETCMGIHSAWERFRRARRGY